MENKRFTLQVQESGERIDALLARSGALSRSAAAKRLEAGMVTVNGRCVAKNYRVTAGDEISVAMPEAAPAEALDRKSVV